MRTVVMAMLVGCAKQAPVEPPLPDLSFADYVSVPLEARPPKRRPSPAFPQEATDAGHTEAACEARVFVGPDGSVNGVEVDGCPQAFHMGVAETLLQWRWPAVAPEDPQYVRLDLMFNLTEP